jgi:hypothetical protein
MRKKGTLQQCWADYARQLPVAGKNVVETRQPLIKFIGVGPGTVRRWMTYVISDGKEGSMPIGEPLIRLRYFLAGIGYKISEFEALDPVTREVGALVAFGPLSFEQLQTGLTYSNIQTLYQVLHGNNQMNNDRLGLARALIAKHRDEYNTLYRRFVRDNVEETRSSEVAESDDEASSHSSPAQSEKAGNLDFQTPDAVVITFAHLISAGIPFAQIMVSDKFTPEQRRKLRAQVGERQFHEFYVLIGQLCSEASRNGSFQGHPVTQPTRKS